MQERGIVPAAAAFQGSPERLERLRLLSIYLAAARSPEQVAERMLAHCIAALGASGGAVRQLSADARSLDALHIVTPDRTRFSGWQQISLGLPLPVTEAVRLGHLLLFDSREQVLARFPHLALVAEEMQHAAFATTPLLVGQQLVGSLSLWYDGPYAFTAEDRAFLEVGAQQCAQALDRVRLAQAEQAARAQLARAESALRDSVAQALRAQHDIDQAYALLDTLIDSAPIGMAFVDREFRFVRINSMLAAFNGLPVEQHIGRRASDIAPSAAAIWEPLWRQVLETGEALIDMELSGPVRGELRHSLVSYYPVRTGAGKILGIGILVTDITARRRGEQAQTLLAQLGDSLGDAESFEAALSLVPELLTSSFADCCDVVLFQRRGGRHRALRHRQESLAARIEQRVPGPARREDLDAILSTSLAGQPARLIADALSHPPADAYLRSLAEASGAHDLILLRLTARGRAFGILWLARTGERRFGEEDLALAEDLARRIALKLDNIQLYEAERAAREEAESAVKLRDQFLSVAAHELKTPLTSLLGNAQLFERRTLRRSALAGSDQRNLKVVIEQAQRLNRMIAMMLDISRLQVGQLSIDRAPLDLGQLLRRIVAEVRPTLTRHDLTLTLPGAPLPLVGDELRLEQVFQNLIQNAIKYSPAGGAIRIAVRYEAGACTVDVSDAGIGIPPAALPRLFQRFFRADNTETHQIGGMGIGLYVVREIVELHAGRVTVESTLGQGSTFRIYLPLAPASP